MGAQSAFGGAASLTGGGPLTGGRRPAVPQCYAPACAAGCTQVRFRTCGVTSPFMYMLYCDFSSQLLFAYFGSNGGRAFFQPF